MKKLLIIGLIFLLTISIVSAFRGEITSIKQEGAYDHGYNRGYSQSEAGMSKNPNWASQFYSQKSAILSGTVDITKEELNAYLDDKGQYLMGYKTGYEEAKSGVGQSYTTPTKKETTTKTTTNVGVSSGGTYYDYDTGSSVKDNACKFGVSDAEAGVGLRPHYYLTKLQQIRGSGANDAANAVKYNRGEFIAGYKECYYGAAETSMSTVGRSGSSTANLLEIKNNAETFGYALGYSQGWRSEKKNRYIFNNCGDLAIKSCYADFHEDVIDTISTDLSWNDVKQYEAALDRAFRDGYQDGRYQNKISKYS